MNSVADKYWDRYGRLTIRDVFDIEDPIELSKLVNHPNFPIRAAVGANTNTPPEALTILSRDERVPVRSGVAKNRNTPPDILAILAHDDDLEVRLMAISNPSTPAEIREKSFLSKRLIPTLTKQRAMVEHGIEIKKESSPEALRGLINSPMAYVKKALLENPYVDDGIKDTLRKQLEKRTGK